VTRKWHLVLWLSSALVAAFAVPAVAVDMGIMTGSEKGTYYQFGLNMQRLVKQRDIDLSVYTSKGSVDNIYAVYQRPKTQLGIVQSDVLAFVARVQTDPVLKRVARKIRMVFPLYNEEIHILGRKGITDFDGLTDRRVAIGREGSGTYLTARLLFRVSDVRPKEMVLIDTDEALAELEAGPIHAMFYVVGYPVKLFTNNVTEADGLTLIPIFNKSITEFYPVAQMPAKTYAWQANPVDTVAVKSVLVSYDFRRLDCDSVGRFAQIVSANLDWLKKNGHPKWQAVDFDFSLKGWEQYDCVRRYVQRTGRALAATRRPSENPVMDAIKEILGN